MSFGDDTLEEALFGRKDTAPHHIPQTQPGVFWMVYIEGTSGPVVCHDNYAKAASEVNRLSQKNPGKKVYLLRSVEWALSTLVTKKEAIEY